MVMVIDFLKPMRRLLALAGTISAFMSALKFDRVSFIGFIEVCGLMVYVSENFPTFSA